MQARFRILLEGAPTTVRWDDELLVAADGRSVPAAEAYLPPVTRSKILCVHLNYESRVAEFGAKLPPAPTYFQKPTSALNAHRGAVVRPRACHYLNFEGEVVIVIGRTYRNVSRDDVGAYIAGYTIGNDFGLHDFRDTDAGSRPVVPGDVVTVEAEGLGALTNSVVEGPVPINDALGAQPSASEEVVSTALGGDWEFRGIRPPRRS